MQFPGADKTSYLLGSTHLFGDKWITQWPLLDSLVAQQENFVCENILAIDQSQAQEFKKKVYAGNSSAKQIFGKDLPVLKRYFLKRFKVDIPQTIDTIKEPVTIKVSIIMALSITRMKE